MRAHDAREHGFVGPAQANRIWNSSGGSWLAFLARIFGDLLGCMIRIHVLTVLLAYSYKWIGIWNFKMNMDTHKPMTKLSLTLKLVEFLIPNNLVLKNCGFVGMIQSETLACLLGSLGKDLVVPSIEIYIMFVWHHNYKSPDILDILHNVLILFSPFRVHVKWFCN